MKKITLSSRSKRSGQGLVVLIILLAVIGAGLWYLYSAKATADREAREFARDAIKRLTVDHDCQSCGVGFVRLKADPANRGRSATTFRASRDASAIHFCRETRRS